MRKSNEACLLLRLTHTHTQTHNMIIVLKALCKSVNTTLGYEGEYFKMGLRDD